MHQWLFSPEKAIYALGRGGRMPVRNSTERQDVAEKATDLFYAFLTSKPVLNSHNTKVACAVLTRYLSSRGHQLDLAPEKAAELARQVTHEKFGRVELHRSIARHLIPASDAARSPATSSALRGSRIFISHAVTRPGYESQTYLPLLLGRLTDGLHRLGATVELPVDERPRYDTAMDRHENSRRRVQASTKVFQASVRRITSNDAVIVLDDPFGCGSTIEREWAKQLAMPIFTLRLNGSVSPLDDMDGWQMQFQLNSAHPEDTADSLIDAMNEHAPLIQDHAAWREAVEIKNEREVSYLRAEWQSLRMPGRRYIEEVSRVASVRIDAGLASGVAWEWLGGRERQALSATLDPPDTAKRGLLDLESFELDLLGQAGDALHLNYREFMACVADVTLWASEPLSRWPGIQDLETAMALLTSSRNNRFGGT